MATSPPGWSRPGTDMADEGGRDHRRSPGRGRGQRILERLSSTDDFTHRDALSLVDRKLILFLIVSLLDDQQCLTTAYEAVLARWAGVEGHWAYGKNLGTIQKACAKYLGRGAEKRPSWRKIVDMVRAALPPDRATDVLAVAAGLFCQAKKIARPDGYGGEIRCPYWAAPEIDRVSVDMIRASGYDAGTAANPPTDDIEQVRNENAVLRRLLEALLHACRTQSTLTDECLRLLGILVSHE